MTSEEFVQRLQDWKQELIDDVISHYQVGNKERGRLAYGRWKGRFISFLREYTPEESGNFQQITYHVAYVVKHGEHPLDQFMREDGEKCLAYIDDLAESVSKGHITLSEKKAPQLSDPSSESREGQDIDSPSKLKKADPEMSQTVNDPRVIFVVHGRNLEARNSLFRFLRSIGLKPMEWSQAIAATGEASPFIGEVLDVAFSMAQAVVVLLTPDDEARLREPFRGKNDPAYESQLTGQARPNVLFEAGMAMGRNSKRTVIVELGTIRPFSDIAGRHTVRLSDNSSSRQELAERLRTAGCPVDLSGRDWHTEGDFAVQHTQAQEEIRSTQEERGAAITATANVTEEYDDDDIIVMLSELIQKRGKEEGSFTIAYSETDRGLGLKAGSTKAHVEQAAKIAGYNIGIKGANTALIRKQIAIA